MLSASAFRSAAPHRQAQVSPLSQHQDFGLHPTPLAEGEEFVDDAAGFVDELSRRELQLPVALVDGRFHLPEVLDCRRIEGVERGEPPHKVLELIWKADKVRERLKPRSASSRTARFVIYRPPVPFGRASGSTFVSPCRERVGPESPQEVIVCDANGNGQRQNAIWVGSVQEMPKAKPELGRGGKSLCVRAAYHPGTQAKEKTPLPEG